MTKKSATAAGQSPAHSAGTTLTPEQRSALRVELGAFLRQTRERHTPPMTQMALSKTLGYTYSIITSWENGSRTILEGQLKAWATIMGISDNLAEEPLARFRPALMPDEAARPNSGTRIQHEMNARLKALREQKGMSIREVGEFLGISPTHLFRIENNQGNLTLEQLRAVSKRFDVPYDYLMDGKGEGETFQSMKAELARLKRENELLESFRQEVEMNRKD